jgi:dipeptidyl aminopeptidase/acylaminoacyl peptidase
MARSRSTLIPSGEATVSGQPVAPVRSILYVLVLAACALPLAPAAAASGEGMRPEQIGELRSVAEVAVSPDGRQVAYVLRVPRDPFEDEDGGAWMELHVVDPVKGSRPFVSGEVKVEDVRWSADGKRITYLAKRGSDEHEALWEIPVDGGESRRVLAHDSEISAYAVSPDGKQVAFRARDKPDERREKLEEQGFDQEVFEEDWRPQRLWIADLEAEDAKPKALEPDGSVHEFEWSPDGKRLVVARAPTPLVDDSYMRKRLRIVEAGSGKVVARIDNPGKLGRFRFSPDGKYVAMISAADLNDPKEGRLMIASVEGGTPRDILPAYPGHVQSFAWQGNDALLFVGDVGTGTTLERIDFLAEKRSTIIPQGAGIMADIHLSSDGSMGVLRGETPQHPAEVFHFDPRSGVKRLTHSNPWLEETRLATQETVRFKARDGLELEGVLVRPLDEQPGKRYPLVLIVHGGPESHHRDGWTTSYSRPAQVLAARGFAVFFTNYRGSTGRGVEFSKLSQADFAGKEFDDLVDAVDHLVRTGLVDKNRVGVTGGSYGGYATAWCSTYYSERFAAGVMSVGISDLLSKVGTSDIPDELYQVHMRKHVWDDWQLMLERSPIRYVEQARTPLLILHGKQDTRVFPGQSMELYRYLETLGNVPVRLVWYPREGHGNRRAAARLDYTLRTVRWMEHYLKGEGGDPPAYEVDYGWDPLAGDDEAGEAGTATGAP